MSKATTVQYRTRVTPTVYGSVEVKVNGQVRSFSGIRRFYQSHKTITLVGNDNKALARFTRNGRTRVTSWS